MNGIGNRLCAMSRKITKFLRNNIIQQLYCELFALVMANIGDYELPVGVKKFVVFVICRYKKLGAGCFGVAQEETSGSSAKRYCLHFLAQQAGMANAACIHRPFP